MEALAFIVMGFVMGLYFSDVYDDYLKRKYSLQQYLPVSKMAYPLDRVRLIRHWEVPIYERRYLY